MVHKKKRSGRPGGKRLGLLLLTPVLGAMLNSGVEAATPTKIKTKVVATSKFDLKTGNLIVNGTVTGSAPGSQVSIYDAASNLLLYSIKTNSKGKFGINIQADKSSLCKIKIEAGNAIAAFPITGAIKGCNTAPICYITGGDQKITTNGSITLGISATKTTKTDPFQFSWNVSNTGPTIVADGIAEPTATGTTLTRSFQYPGLYHVALTGSNSKGSCNDNITVSVAPPAAAVPATVDALAAAARATAPQTASALNAPSNDYVVLPFEETGMQGGSQINLPYNAQIPYDSLNAQVIQKKAHKPPLVSNSVVDIFYSAGVNPNDPVGSDSINSTSQNWFSDSSAGANVDLTASVVDSTSQAPTNNVFINGHDFTDAVIRKTEQWDRLYQKNHSTQTGIDMAWQQNRFTPAKPLAAPDEGIRGNLDNGNGVRAMPGVGKPYEVNDPQATVFNADQTAFVAQFIPASNVDDKGRTNPYPLMRVEAKVGNETVAKADTVFTTASETRCRECHLPGGIAADDQVWRTPVSESEMKLADGSPGPATGAGSFDPGLVATKAWPPAIHNHFDDRHPEKTNFTNLMEGALDVTDRSTGTTFVKGIIARDANDRRTDRVKESRWVKLDAAGKPTAETSPTRPAQFAVAPVYTAPADPAKPTPAELTAINTAIAAAENQANANAQAAGWAIQFKIKFKSAADYGDANDPIAQEKAALFNTLVMHDYMVFYGPTPAQNKTWPASYSSQLADAYSEDDLGTAAAKPMYFCSGHHQSQLKFDVGIAAKTPATNRSDYSRAFHAFHGKMQTYKENVTAANSADGLTHKAGELIRDSRGHPLMYGGRGWDSQMDDDNGIPLKIQIDANGHPATPPFADNAALKGTDPSKWDSSKFSVPTWDPAKNNWRPDLPQFKMHAKGQLILGVGDKVAMEDNCVTCHTGKTEKSYRDIHHAAGLKCDSCHGDMLAVGNVFPNEGFDANLTWAGAMGKDNNNAYATDNGAKGDAESLKVAVANLGISEPNDFRRPWLDQPDCGSCHFGDANGETKSMPSMYMKPANLFSAGALKQAWANGDKSGKSITPMNARFAVMPNKESRPEKYTALYTAADVAAAKLVDPNTKVKVGDAKSTSYTPQPLSQALYRKSGDVHGSGANGILTCSTCHGGSHATWPNPDPNANDNVTAKQLQGYDGNIAECSVCHVKDDFKTGLVATDGGASGLGVAQGVRENSTTDLAVPNANNKNAKAFLAGPHGLHPVNDESWWKTADGITVDDFKNTVITNKDRTKTTLNGGWHSEMTYKPGPDGEDQCAACHGADHKGTRLSKTLVARTFVNDKGKAIKVEAGQVIGCNLCHTMDRSFKRAPKDPNDPKGKAVKWPLPKMHMPPLPEAIDPVPAGTVHNH